ncbi:MAG: metallophosphoesterase [Candidatus Omnitrophica bacterium]|nr:metallophosphoesterase [Candidatus Omnitrophota bacterium]
MKIVAIADTHIPERSDKLPLELLEEIKLADAVIHAGDFVSLELFKELKAICKQVIAVRGNMDAGELAKELPEKEIFKVGKFRIGVMHGYGAPGRVAELLLLEFKKDKLDMIVFGHSHTPLNEKIGSVIMFNPGSPTDKVFAPYVSYGVIEIDDKIEAKIVKL